MKGIYLFLSIFLLMSLIDNLVPKFPRLPWDVNLDKKGIYIKIPFLSALVISFLLILLYPKLLQ